MKVLITGGAGFLGQRLTRELLRRGSLADSSGRTQPIDEIILADIVAAHDFGDPRVRVVTADIADAAVCSGLVSREVASVFHLAAVVSGQAEMDFDLGMRINLDATQHLLAACRAGGHRPKVVFTSSVAVYGGPLPPVVQDTTALRPQSSYGTQKAIGELLVGDYSRKQFIDGRVLRLPTISVRPGKPNKAASSFASGIIREPLNGESSICPVSPDLRLWLLSPRRAIGGLIAGHDVPEAALGGNCTLNLPGLSVSVGDMLAALEAVAGAETARRVSFAPDAAVERIVRSWPAAWDCARAQALGLSADADFAAIIQAYREDDMASPGAQRSTRPSAQT